MLTLLVAFAAASALVLADSGLRLCSAIGGIKVRREALLAVQAGTPQRQARVKTRVSYGRQATAKWSRPAPMRAAA